MYNALSLIGQEFFFKNFIIFQISLNFEIKNLINLNINIDSNIQISLFSIIT